MLAILAGKKQLIQGFAIGGAIVLAGLIYWDSQRRLVKEAEDRAETELLYNIERQTREVLIENGKKQEETIKELREDLKAANAYTRKLERTLSRHNLTKLTAAKPGLIESRINNATQDLFDDLTDISNDRMRLAE